MQATKTQRLTEVRLRDRSVLCPRRGDLSSRRPSRRASCSTRTERAAFAAVLASPSRSTTSTASARITANENLAVLCLDCHHETQVSGGFARTLDAEQVRVFRNDWHVRVRRWREVAGLPGVVGGTHEGAVGGLTSPSAASDAATVASITERYARLSLGTSSGASTTASGTRSSGTSTSNGRSKLTLR